MASWFLEALQHVLTALATAGVLYVLLRQSKRAPARDVAGHLVLRQPPFYRALGLVSAGIGALMLLGTLVYCNWARLLHDAHEQLGFGFVLFSALLFIGLSVPMLRASATTLTLTPLGVASNGPRGKHTFLLWQAVNKVRYNSMTYELKISTPQGSIKAGRYLIGFDQLVVELTRRLHLTPTQMGLPANGH